MDNGLFGALKGCSLPGGKLISLLAPAPYRKSLLTPWYITPGPNRRNL